MSLSGADAAALYAFANEIRTRRARIKEATLKLGSLLEQADWVGPDRESFVAEWQGRHGPTLMSMIEDLAKAAREVAEHARRQEETSAQ